jgi:glutamate dehydrogenase (NAD(P)+)
VVRRFARLIFPYREIYLPGPDVGTNDADMRIVAIENGLDSAVSKPVEMGGNQIDHLGAAAGGVVIAIEQLLLELPRLRSLPQFAGIRLPPDEVTVLIQGQGGGSPRRPHPPGCPPLSDGVSDEEDIFSILRAPWRGLSTRGKTTA